MVRPLGLLQHFPWGALSICRTGCLLTGLAVQHRVYPSPQMFFNAMQRKGFSPNEGEMSTVVVSSLPTAWQSHSKTEKRMMGDARRQFTML